MKDTTTHTRESEFLVEARNAFKANLPRKALSAVEEGFAENPPPREGAELHKIAAGIHIKRNNITKAVHHGNLSVELAELTHDPQFIANCLTFLGKVCARAGLLEESDRHWHRALQLVRLEDRPRDEGRLLSNLGINQQREGMPEAALELFQKSHARLKKAHDYTGLGVCLGRMASLCLEEDLELAQEKVAELVKIAEREDNKKLSAIAGFRQGEIFMQKDEYEEAGEHFERAANLFREIGDLRNLVLVSCEYCRAMIRLGNQEAFTLSFEAASELVGSDTLLVDAQLVLAEAAAWRGDKKAALTHYRDSLDLVGTIGTKDKYLVFQKSLKAALEAKKLCTREAHRLIKRVKREFGKVNLEEEAREIEQFLPNLNT